MDDIEEAFLRKTAVTLERRTKDRGDWYHSDEECITDLCCSKSSDIPEIGKCPTEIRKQETEFEARIGEASHRFQLLGYRIQEEFKLHFSLGKA